MRVMLHKKVYDYASSNKAFFAVYMTTPENKAHQNKDKLGAEPYADMTMTISILSQICWAQLT